MVPAYSAVYQTAIIMVSTFSNSSIRPLSANKKKQSRQLAPDPRIFNELRENLTQLGVRSLGFIE